MLKKFALLALLVSAFVLGIIVLQSENPSEGEDLVSVSIRLPIPVADSAFAPFYIAVDEGIYKKAGLDVKLELGTPDLNPIKMVSQNIDEFGVLGGPELLLSGVNKGAYIKGIMRIHKDSDFVVLLTLKSSGITSLEQLEGKRVGMFYGHVSTDVLRMLFKKNGVVVEEVDVGFNYGPLLSGDLDAEWAFRTTAGITLPSQGAKLNMISPEDYGIKTDGHVVVVNSGFEKANPDIVRKFVAATKEGLDISLNNLDKVVASVQARNSKLTTDVIEKQMAVYSPAIKRNKPAGYFDAEAMERVKAQMLSIGLIDKDADVNSSFTNKYVGNYEVGPK
ncbi:MAG: ABC transporter substrate-binding protein [Candidatus Thiodiazotropha endolucinida]